MKELTNLNYPEVVDANSGLIVLEFYSPSCTHCKKMERALADVESEMENKVLFFKCNVFTESVLALRYDVNSVPTIIILKGEQEVNRFTGYTHPLIIKEAVSGVK